MSSATVSQINPALLNQLRPVLRRERLRRVFAALAITWIFLALVGLLMLLLNRSAESVLDAYIPDAWVWLGGLASVGTLVAIVIAWLSMPTAEGMARQVEAEFPELDSVLMTAIEQTPGEDGGLSFFQYDVIQKALRHGLEQKWASVVPLWKLFSSSFGAMAGLIGIFGNCLLLFLMPPPELDQSIHLFSDIENSVRLDLQCSVQPGDVEIERGTNLLVLAEFSKDTPPKAELVFSPESGEQRIKAMTKSLEDPVFATQITQVDESLTYLVQFADEESKSFRVTVFDYPQLVRTDVQLLFPEYTNLPEKKLQDTRRFSAVAGTQATLQFHVNKEVASATLKSQSDVGQTIELAQNDANPRLWETELIVERSEKYRLHLIDDQQRENKSPPLLTVRALVNNPPELKLIEPARDLAVSALEEVALSASVWDDFGLLRSGLAWSVGGSEPKEIELAGLQDGKKKHVVDHLLELEAIGAEPDQLVSWHFWAEDIGPDGESRRSESDMFFAEVRRFEEIFRQAQGGQGQQQQQQGQASQGAEQAGKLADLQKQIINANWRVIRRERSEPLSAEFDGDVSLLVESQQSVSAQADELIENLNDDIAKALAGELKSLINEAVDKLQSAKEMPSADPLTDAIRIQQSAWQTFLKMRAREIQVQQSRQQQQSSSSSSQSARNQQLQQMELTKQEDRYEQERQAQEESEQAQQQRENRQILSRLRELARRQDDLNKRVKELQSALEEAESEEEEEELKKQLKRLEEEQQQLLRDTDEVQERMEESKQQQTEQMDQLQQARENVQRSAEALKQGDLSRAATEGTRAERELTDLRDEFQKQTAGQFNEQMRQMRNQTQDLQQQQEQLAEQLKGEDRDDPASRRLDGDDKRDQIVKGLREGKEQVEKLRDIIKDTIEEAEEFEPLLADELYDTYRKSEQSRPDRALEFSADSIERGMNEDAQSIHDIAMDGIKELNEGVDRAAQRVLGDETEALKAARDTIKQLSRELDDEIERNNPQGDPGNQEQGESDGEPSQDRDRQREQQQDQRGQDDSDENQNRQEQQGRRQSEQQPKDEGSGEQQGQNGGGERAQSEQAGGRGSNETQEGQRPQGRNRGGNRLDGESPNERRLGGNIGPNLGGNFAPITGDEFRQWSDRLRDVEEMIADPDLRADAARIRDQAKAIRKELKRHSPTPDWDRIKLELAEPLAELQSRVTQEILRRDPKNTLVPLNQEPVPTQYQNAVRKYYEQLGTGQ